MSYPIWRELFDDQRYLNLKWNTLVLPYKKYGSAEMTDFMFVEILAFNSSLSFLLKCVHPSHTFVFQQTTSANHSYGD